LRVSKDNIRRRLVKQRRKLPRSTSGLSSRSKRPRRRLLKPLLKPRRKPKRLRIESISLI
jgi:hypothetical protein